MLYHLIEDSIFESYMKDLFNSSTKYVIIYSCNFDDNPNFSNHVKPRIFTNWIEENISNFILEMKLLSYHFLIILLEGTTDLNLIMELVICFVPATTDV